MDPVTATILAIGASSVSAGVSAAGASQQNKAIRQSMLSQQQAAQIQQRQLGDQSALERIKAIRSTRDIRGRLRVAAGESGVASNSGSYAALDRQAIYDGRQNVDIIKRNLFNQQQAVASGAQANIASLASNQQSPILAAFMGGVQGLQTGLSIVGVGENINQLRQENV